jgi:hypothetical protein
MIDNNTISLNMARRLWKITPIPQQWEDYRTGGSKCQAHKMSHKPGTQ